MVIEYNDEIYDMIDKVFSCIIREDNKIAYDTFSLLTDIIKEEELNGVHFIVFRMLLKQREIVNYNSSFSFNIVKDNLEANLTAGINNIMSKYEKKFINLLTECDVDTNLTISANYEKACSVIITQVKDFYDNLYNNPDNDVPNVMEYMSSLTELLQNAFSRQSILTGGKIMTDGIKIGRKFYKGTEDYINYTTQIKSIYEYRFENIFKSTKEEVDLMTPDDYIIFSKENNNKVHSLFNFGIPPLDQRFSCSNSDIVTIIGDEGIGKTNLLVFLAMQAIMSGLDVLFMRGESDGEKIINMFLSRYIFLKHGYRITWQECRSYEDLADEEIQHLIVLSRKEMLTDDKIGRLHLIKEFSYEQFYEKASEKIRKFSNIGLVCIDHTDRLKSEGTLTSNSYLSKQMDRVSFLYKKEIELSDDFPVAVINLSHTSSDASKSSAKGKEVGTRIGASSSATTKDSDFVFYLSKTEELGNENLVKFSIKKIRDYADNIKPIILEKEFEVCNFKYDEQLQYKADIDDEEIDDII